MVLLPSKICNLVEQAEGYLFSACTMHDGGMGLRLCPRINIFDLYLFRRNSTKFSFPVSSRNALENSTADSWQSWLQQFWCPSVRQEYYTCQGMRSCSFRNVELANKKSGSIFNEFGD